jgi:hypothetical protein
MDMEVKEKGRIYKMACLPIPFPSYFKPRFTTRNKNL